MTGIERHWQEVAEVEAVERAKALCDYQNWRCPSCGRGHENHQLYSGALAQAQNNSNMGMYSALGGIGNSLGSAMGF